ncbi:MAG: NAD(P)/FAD-dependent oxidoreductase [Promethearchaeota archaeon]
MPRSKVWDVIICGAGIGGAIAAEVLAAKGFTTLLLEKHTIPRYKVCGGAVSQEFVDRFKLPDDIIARHVEYLVLHHIDHQVFEKKGRGACIWRANLDAFFTKNAVTAGATLKENSQVIAAHLDDDTYHVHTPNNRFRARTLIAADGVSSTILRCFGWNRFTSDDVAHTITHEIELGETTIARRFGDQHLHLYFGHRVSQMGYGWVFPKRKTVSVGWGCRLSLIRNITKSFTSFLDLLSEELEGGKLVRKAAHLIPAALRRRFGVGGLLAVGDAAGLVDPISGKGITYAATSGRLAAKVMIQALETETIPDAAAVYQSLLEKSLLNGLKSKKTIQTDIYRTEENIHRFLQLWLDNRATVIASSLW